MSPVRRAKRTPWPSCWPGSWARAFQAQTLSARIIGLQDKTAAVILAQELLAGAREESEIAEITGLLYALTGDEQHRLKALELFVSLRRRIPSFKFREKIVALGGSNRTGEDRNELT
ncbi:MAG: hypothetical protein QME74_05665 [Candidatus Edwardsbacteria bacterium]|nr:hypothetical protein [Candidatus Edwardsbacteria bacterium]